MQIFANDKMVFVFLIHGILCDTCKKSKGKNLNNRLMNMFNFRQPKTSVKFYFFKNTRLDSVESIPLILHEFLEDLKDTNRVGSVESLWSRGEEVEIRMIQGTPLSPPKTNANVIILEMTNEDEVNIKMYCTLLLSIT